VAQNQRTEVDELDDVAEVKEGEMIGDDERVVASEEVDGQLYHPTGPSSTDNYSSSGEDNSSDLGSKISDDAEKRGVDEA